jgi:hypothetical protein
VRTSAIFSQRSRTDCKCSELQLAVDLVVHLYVYATRENTSLKKLRVLLISVFPFPSPTRMTVACRYLRQIILNDSWVSRLCNCTSVTDREMTRFVIPCLFMPFSLSNWRRYWNNSAWRETVQSRQSATNCTPRFSLVTSVILYPTRPR